MKKLIYPLVIIVLGLLVTAPSVGQKKLMPVTTKSEKARALFQDAYKASQKVDAVKSEDLTLQALKEDPGFFLANLFLAEWYLFSNDTVRFRTYAAGAIRSEAKLSKGELLLKDAARQLMDNPGADVTPIGKKLVEMYPADEFTYSQLSFFQTLIKDFKGVEETMKKALTISGNPAPLYNMLGYACMYQGKYDDARIALDRYIELEPDNPNVYDSKGDFHMQVKEYQKAYENYWKAYKLNPAWSYAKAMNAKTFADSPYSEEQTIAERKAIRSTIEGEIKASFNGDYTKWTTYLSHEPYSFWMQAAKSEHWIRSGWDNINTSMKDIVKPERKGSLILDGISDYQLRLYKDAALVTFTVKGTQVSGGEKKPFTGREVRSLEKKDGAWKIVYLGTVYTSTYDK